MWSVPYRFGESSPRPRPARPTRRFARRGCSLASWAMDGTNRRSRGPRARGVAAGTVVFALPLVGLISLLLRSQLDPHFENYRIHFVVFGLTGGVAFALGFAAGEAAELRGDARVLLLSLAFMATGGFMLLHAVGTHEVLFTHQHAGFQVAISVGLLVSAVFAGASAFIDVRRRGPRRLPARRRHRQHRRQAGE